MEMLHIEELTMPAFSVFVEHECLQHDGLGWRRTRSLRFQTFLITASYGLNNAVAFVYGASVEVRKNDAAHLKKWEPDADRTKEDYKSEKGESKIEDSASERMDSLQASD